MLVTNYDDLSILVAAYQAGCRWLVTFNTRHYQPGLEPVIVLKPGTFLLQVRDRLSGLDRYQDA